MELKILGIGQSLRGDDSAGLEVVRRWQKTRPDPLPAGLDTALLESPGLNLLSHFGGHDALILVDAVQSGAAPGTLHRLRVEELAAFLEGAESAHGWGIAETLQLAQTLGRDDLPAEIHILGIEMASVEPGRGLSPAVEAALPRAVQALDALVEKLLSSRPS